jgi:hypothetical protein
MSVAPSPAQVLQWLRPVQPDWQRLAEAAFPDAEFDGVPDPFLSISECIQTAYFQPSREAAERAIKWIDDFYCDGRRCRMVFKGATGYHYVVSLGDPGASSID